MSIHVTDIAIEAVKPELPVKLETAITRGGRLVGTWLLGIFMSAGTATLILFVVREWNEQRWTAIGLAAAAAVLGLLALLLLWSALQQSLSSTIAVTSVEVSKQPVAPGDTVTLCVHQPGPVYLNSLRANLVGIRRIERQTVAPDGTVRHERSPDKMTIHENILDAGGGRVPRGMCRQWMTTFVVPGNADDSGKEDSIVSEWTIEVWGKACFGLVGFLYQFPIKVRDTRC
jgi:hypothetical protein